MSPSSNSFFLAIADRCRRALIIGPASMIVFAVERAVVCLRLETCRHCYESVGGQSRCWAP